MTIVSAFAEFERDRIGERIRQAKQVQKASGEYLGGKHRFGWRVGDAGDARTLVPVPQEQKALARMRVLRSEGLSFRKIAELVAADGVLVSHMGVKLALAAADREGGNAAA